MSDQVTMQVKGTNGTLQLLPDRIRIVREGWLAHLYDRKSTTELLLQQIRDIEFKHTIGGIAGYLAFHDAEDRETYEDFCVSFLKPQERVFLEIRDAIAQRREEILDSHEATGIELLTG